MNETLKTNLKFQGLCKTLEMHKNLTIDTNELSDYIKALSLYLQSESDKGKEECKAEECKAFVALLIKNKKLLLNEQQKKQLSTFLLQNNNYNVVQLQESLGQTGFIELLKLNSDLAEKYTEKKGILELQKLLNKDEFSKLLKLNSDLAEKYVEEIYEAAMEKSSDENKIKKLSEGLSALRTGTISDGQKIPCLKEITAGILKLAEKEEAEAENRNPSYKTKLTLYIPAIIDVAKNINLKSVDDETKNNLNQILNKYFDFFQQQNTHLSSKNQVYKENLDDELNKLEIKEKEKENSSTIQQQNDFVKQKLDAIKARMIQIEKQLEMFHNKSDSAKINFLDLLNRENLEKINKLQEEFFQLTSNYQCTLTKYKELLENTSSISLEPPTPEAEYEEYLQKSKDIPNKYSSFFEKINSLIKKQQPPQSTDLSQILNSIGCTLSEPEKTSTSKTTTDKQKIMYAESSSSDNSDSQSQNSKHVANIEGNTIEILDNDPKSTFLPKFIIGLAKSEKINNFSINDLSQQQIDSIIDYFTKNTSDVTLEVLEKIRKKINTNTNHTDNDTELLKKVDELIKQKKETNRKPILSVKEKALEALQQGNALYTAQHNSASPTTTAHHPASTLRPSTAPPAILNTNPTTHRRHSIS